MNWKKKKCKDCNKFFETLGTYVFRCIKCRKEFNDAYNKKYRKSYYFNNKEKVKVYNKIYYNSLNQKNKSNIWRLKNRENIQQKKRERYYNDYKYRLEIVLRNRFKTAVKKEFKTGSSLKLIGCSIEELKKYLESKFRPGMTWENYSYSTWHIDHIIPISSFDLTKDDEQKKCFHYTNLQPLWAKENNEKYNKVMSICINKN